MQSFEESAEAEAPAAGGDADGHTDRQFAITLARGLDVLRCFTAADPILDNKEISRRTSLPKPTVSRMTYTLTCLGYLRHLPWAGKYGKYELGPAVLSIGHPLLANIGLRQAAKEPMQGLADCARGWVTMGVRERLNMVYVETARSKDVIKSQADIGQTFPIVMSAMGRAYLAGLTEGERDAVINQIKVKTPEDWKKYAVHVEEGLADFRLRGFCLHHGAWNPHVHTVAVPMRRMHNDHIVVFNCVVPAHSIRRGQLEEDLGPRLVRMVRQIEHTLEAG